MKKLTRFERDMLRVINIVHGTNYNYRHLSEWNSNKAIVESKMIDGELLYEAFGCWVAINPKAKNK